MRKSLYLSGLLLAGLTLNGCQQAPNSSSTTPVKPGQPAPANTAATADSADVQPANAGPKTFRTGIVVPVGVVAYRVESVEFADKLADGAKPEAGKQFLTLKLSMRNTGSGEAPVGTFKVVDGKNEYNLSAKGEKAEGTFYGVKTLAKDELKKGVVIFETPKTSGLKLKINSITPVQDEMFIELDGKK